MQKLSYDLNIYRLSQNLTQQFMDKGMIVNTKIIDYHNQICPSCRAEFKRSGNVIKGASHVGALIPYDKNNVAVLYAVCKGCVRFLNHIATSSEAKNRQDSLEDYIYEIIPELNV